MNTDPIYEFYTRILTRRRSIIWIVLATSGATRMFIVLSFTCCGLTKNTVRISMFSLPGVERFKLSGA